MTYQVVAYGGGGGGGGTLISGTTGGGGGGGGRGGGGVTLTTITGVFGGAGGGSSSTTNTIRFFGSLDPSSIEPLTSQGLIDELATAAKIARDRICIRSRRDESVLVIEVQGIDHLLHRKLRDRVESIFSRDCNYVFFAAGGLCDEDPLFELANGLQPPKEWLRGVTSEACVDYERLLLRRKYYRNRRATTHVSIRGMVSHLEIARISKRIYEVVDRQTVVMEGVVAMERVQSS